MDMRKKSGPLCLIGNDMRVTVLCFSSSKYTQSYFYNRSKTQQPFLSCINLKMGGGGCKRELSLLSVCKPSANLRQASCTAERGIAKKQNTLDLKHSLSHIHCPPVLNLSGPALGTLYYVTINY